MATYQEALYSMKLDYYINKYFLIYCLWYEVRSIIL